MIASSRDVAFYLAEATILLLWMDFLSSNINKSNYLNTLNYWFTIKMNENSLHAAEELGIV